MGPQPEGVRTDLTQDHQEEEVAEVLVTGEVGRPEEVAEVLVPGVAKVLVPGVAEVLVPGVAEILVPGVVGRPEEGEEQHFPMEKEDLLGAWERRTHKLDPRLWRRHEGHRLEAEVGKKSHISQLYS